MEANLRAGQNTGSVAPSDPFFCTDVTDLKNKRKFVSSGGISGCIRFQVRRCNNGAVRLQWWTRGEVGVGELRKPWATVTRPRQTTQSKRVGGTQRRVQPTNITVTAQGVGAEPELEIIERRTATSEVCVRVSIRTLFEKSFHLEPSVHHHISTKQLFVFGFRSSY